MKILKELTYLWLFSRLGSLLRVRTLIILIIPVLLIWAFINIILLLGLKAAMDSLLLALIVVILINIGLIFLLSLYVKKKFNTLKSRFKFSDTKKDQVKK